MKRVYVDTSALIAVHFGEAPGPGLLRFLKSQDELLSVAFVRAELLSMLNREGRPLNEASRILKRLSLFSPAESLQAECEEALGAGYLRGADLWHVAAALALAGRRGRKALTFCTVDAAQGSVAAKLGFRVAPG